MSYSHVIVNIACFPLPRFIIDDANFGIRKPYWFLSSFPLAVNLKTVVSLLGDCVSNLVFSRTSAISLGFSSFMAASKTHLMYRDDDIDTLISLHSIQYFISDAIHHSVVVFGENQQNLTMCTDITPKTSAVRWRVSTGSVKNSPF